jgi:hypothetical protein
MSVNSDGGGQDMQNLADPHRSREQTISDVTRGNEFGNSHVGMTDATDEHDHAAITIFGR